jgi:dTDP-4-dehydrorhamnose 3,5-epimerase
LIKYETPFEGVFLLGHTAVQDRRGTFRKLFCDLESQDIKILNQVNVVTNQQAGIIRGLHFQYPPFEEEKIIYVLLGKIFDVIVDLRPDSSTFLQKFEIILSAEENTSLQIPKGFAHGYQTITEESHIVYLHRGHHNPAAESGLHFSDPELSINWPLPITYVSKRDTEFEPLNSRTDMK